MKIIFLGTNGWYTTATGNTACVLIDSQTDYVIFDAGNGLYKIDKYITQQKPISLFISHFHLDHVSGLHSLAKFKFPQGMDIYVGPGRKKDFDTLVQPPFTVGIDKDPNNIATLSTEIRVHELAEGKQQIPFLVEVVEQFHAYRNHGYRVNLEGKTIAYSGDTGIGPNSRLLAQNADLLIHECSYMKAPKDDKWGHVDATQATNLAKEAGVKKLILTHFDPTQSPFLKDRKKAESEAQAIFPNTTCATDDLIVTV